MLMPILTHLLAFLVGAVVMFAVARWALAARRNEHLLNPRERKEIHHLFHHLWSAAVGSPGYGKRDWVRLEGLLKIQSLHDSRRD